MTVLEKLTQDDPSIVWISWGHSMGLAAKKYLDNFKRIGQIYGIVGASAFNNGYAGLRLFEIENIEGPNASSRSKKIAFFYRGPQPAEATASLIDSLQNQDDPLDPKS
ncbi:MAG: hypothetical protein CVU15_11505 [Betaproteobacteria bacterium HGW-Betaproteobacteria-1]|nr:MAG: hypothetical protein CVU15_11505 [Betaproteobacteria bacterium HGW-Betaproteobacteria-1]